MAVEGRAILDQASVELRDHAETETSIRRDVLIAAETTGERAAVATAKADQRQRIVRRSPHVVAPYLAKQPLKTARIAAHHIQSRCHAHDPMDEQHEVDP